MPEAPRYAVPLRPGIEKIVTEKVDFGDNIREEDVQHTWSEKNHRKYPAKYWNEQIALLPFGGLLFFFHLLFYFRSGAKIGNIIPICCHGAALILKGCFGDRSGIQFKMGKKDGSEKYKSRKEQASQFVCIFMYSWNKLPSDPRIWKRGSRGILFYYISFYIYGNNQSSFSYWSPYFFCLRKKPLHKEEYLHIVKLNCGFSTLKVFHKLMLIQQIHIFTQYERDFPLPCCQVWKL